MPTDLPPPAVVLTVPKPVLTFDKLIAAIEEKENGLWSNDGGRANWKRETWAQFTMSPFRFAKEQEDSRLVMRWALQRYTDRFIAMEETPTVWKLAMCWRYGFEGARKKRRVRDDYGDCVANLCEAKTP